MEAQLQKVKYNLLYLNPLNTNFDPYEHETSFYEGHEPGTLVLVSKVGDKLHGHMLWPILVGVVKET